VDADCAPPDLASCAFASPEAAAADLSTREWRPVEALPVSVGSGRPVGRRFYWRVRACCDDCCSVWSPVRYLDAGRVPADLNGDGYSDVLVGEPGFDEAGAAGEDVGRVQVYFGAPVPGSAAGLVFTGDRGGGRAGSALAAVGDFDGDGYADFAVGAPASGTGEAGRVLLLRGGIPTDVTVDAVFEGTPGEGFGASVAGAGDVNGDGYADILVGAPGDAAGSDGRARVFFGGPGLDTTPDLELAGTHPGERFGWSVAGAGDIDGDGYADLLAGAPENDEGGAGLPCGAAYLFLGGPAPGGTPVWAVRGGYIVRSAPYSNAGHRLGESVAGAGDFNGDGYADIVVGVPYDGHVFTGEARLYLGGASPHMAADVTFRGSGSSYSGMNLGAAVAGIGDLDNDGFDDVAVGAPAHTPTTPSSRPQAGLVRLYCGAAVPGTVEEEDAEFEGPFWNTYLGRSVAGAGDVDGDGVPDLVVGAPGLGGDERVVPRAYILLGPASALESIELVSGSDAEALFGASVAMCRPRVPWFRFG
jgi:hypothetical protein